MKLALIVETYNPTGGGAERNAAEVAAHLRERGHQVTVLCARGEGERSPGGPIRSAHAVRVFHDWVASRLGDFDASLSMTTIAPATVVQPLGGSVRQSLLRNAASKGWPVSFTLSRKRRAALAVESRVFEQAQAVACLSQYVIDDLTRHFKLPREKLHRIPNAVTPPAVTDALRRETRATLGLGNDDTAYLFSAFNPRLKGLPTLMRAFARLDRGVLMLTGKIPNRLRGPRVKVIGPVTDMTPWYAACDVLVHPTFHDPSSRVVIEALLCGKAVITTRYNGAAELVGEAGVVLDDPRDHPGLTAAMRQLAGVRPAVRVSSLTLVEHVAMLERLLSGSGRAAAPRGSHT